MSTAHEVLVEVRAARVSEQARDEEQKKLFGRCWCPRYFVMAMAIMALISFAHLAILVAQYLKNPEHPPVIMAAVAFANILLAIGAIITRLTRRSAALAELIRQKAPALHDELLLNGVL